MRRISSIFKTQSIRLQAKDDFETHETDEEEGRGKGERQTTRGTTKNTLNILQICVPQIIQNGTM